MIRSADRSRVVYYCWSMEFPKRSFKRKAYVCRYVRWIPSVHEVEVSRGVRKIDDAFRSKRVGAWLDLQTAGLFTCQRQPGEIVVSWKRRSRGPTNNPTANASVARWADRFDSRAIERVWIYAKAVLFGVQDCFRVIQIHVFFLEFRILELHWTSFEVGIILLLNARLCKLLYLKYFS